MARSRGQADPRQFICEGVVNHCAKLRPLTHGCNKALALLRRTQLTKKGELGCMEHAR
jgi:hypothetical protein